MTDLLDRPAAAASGRAPVARRLRVRGFGPGGWFRKTLFWTHLVVALASGIIVLVMSVTGVALAYQKQLSARALTSRAAAPAPGAVRLPLDEVAARASAAMAGERPAALTVSADPAMPVAVVFEGRRTVAVNPYTGAATAISPGMQRFFGFMERLHRSMTLSGGMRNPLGTRFTGAANLGFLFLVLSGMLLWIPRRWSRHAVRAVTVPAFRADGRARDWNWHHVAGIWFAPVLVLIVASGAFMSYRWPTALVARMAGDPPPPAGGEGGPRGGAAASGRGEGGEARPGAGARQGGAAADRGEASIGRGEGGLRGRGGVRAGESGRGGAEGRGSGRGGSPVRLAALWPAAERQVPGWSSISIRLPRGGDAPVSFTISRDGGIRPTQRATLTLDPATGAVKEFKRYQDNRVSQRVRSWMRPLHTGEAFGLVGQTIAALASAAGALLVWTGFALAWRRMRSWQKRRSRAAAAAR